MEQDYIKLIFGLKLKQIRTDRELSLFGLSKLSGLSKSYLNEIEKGKKYPKPDKIAALSEHLDVPYDDLVSLKLDKNLAPIGEILQSKLLKEIPLELFGIQESTLIDIIANAPQKVTAFISTIIDIARNHDFSRENFFLASVRSFQEANNNYFEHLEQFVIKFAKTYQIDLKKRIQAQELEDILVEEFGYTINNDELEIHNELSDLRSIFVPKSNTLLINNSIDDAQRTFIYAKELAYNYLKIEDRLYTFSWIAFDNFDQVLNNFYASYFAGALIMPRQSLVAYLKSIFEKRRFKKSTFEALLNNYNVSPESLYQRATNVLPKDFNLRNLFFLRFSHQRNSQTYNLKKELHLAKPQSPRANETNEKYCLRWISLRVIQQLKTNNSQHEFDIQISNYPSENTSYLVLASATADPFIHDAIRSVSIGIKIDRQLKGKVNFLEDKSIKTVDVGVTCERCAIENCKVRRAPAKVLMANLKEAVTAGVVATIQKKFS